MKYYKNIQQLYDDIESKVESANTKYKIQQLYNFIKGAENVNLYYCLLDIKGFIPKLSNTFEDALLININKWSLNDFESDYHLFIISTSMRINLVLNDMYENNEPFREEKYLEKSKTFLNKNRDLVRRASPQAHLKLFRARMEELLQNFNFQHDSTTKREKIRDRNLVLDDLIKVVVSTNYINDSHFRADKRVTKKTKEFLRIEDEIENLTSKTQKKYFKIIK